MTIDPIFEAVGPMRLQGVVNNNGLIRRWGIHSFARCSVPSVYFSTPRQLPRARSTTCAPGPRSSSCARRTRRESHRDKPSLPDQTHNHP